MATVRPRPLAPAGEVLTLGRRPALSLVIPLHDEEGSLMELHRRLTDVLTAIGQRYEILFIDDGSQDGSPAVLRQLFDADPRVSVYTLRRNFGKAQALDTGFTAALGEIIITLDAYLQDDPTEIPRFLERIEQGADLVVGWKRRRHDPWHKVLPSRFFNLVNRLSFGLNLHDMNCGFKAMRREVLGELGLYGELHRYIPIYAHARGFRVAEIPVTHHPRRHGRSKYGIERYLKGFFDFLTSLLLTKFAKRPLHFFGGVGFALGTLGFLICAVLTYQWIMGDRRLSERPLLILGVMLIILGVQTISIGLVGEMMIHREETKDHQAQPLREVLRHDEGV
ncbi:MAG TPA: glycosyltransferase family 2 protein [bacterium]|nr:glycosyltransferase family 2 protein [bacterium]